MEEPEVIVAEPVRRITPADIEDNIRHVAFMTGATFLSRAERVDHKDKDVPMLQASHLTICMVTTRNGFMVIGRSAPADPKNFDHKMGRKLAYEDCVKQLWPLMGYELRSELAAEPSSGPAQNDVQSTVNS